jgi:hypothetical protein
MNLSNPNERQTLAAQIKNEINEWCTHKYKSGHREHLGASIMGETCSRKIWYIFRWCKEQQIDGRLQRLFQVGHNAEPRFVEYLEGVGFKVYTRDASTNEQFRILGVCGHYGGSVDALASYNEEAFICEFKTNGTGVGFTNVEAQGLQKAKPVHWAQMCQYGYKLQIKYGLYLIENKNDSDITIQIVELDWKYGQQLENKAKDVIEAKYPPQRISEQPSYYECKWCQFRDICHYNEPVDNNCRSCKNAVPVENAQWQCIKFNCLIPKEEIGKQHECHKSINA